MTLSLKNLACRARPETIAPGHSACSGCGGAIIWRQTLLAAENPVVVGVASGCLYVAMTTFPWTAVRAPFIHNAFENAAATMSGIESAYRALTRRGRLDRPIDFIVFAGDGGTYDIGFQSLSGMLERGHRVLYVCYDNQAYMNTGVQRSSSTPRGASTNTSPVSEEAFGKREYHKDLTGCIIAHSPAYVAQASPHDYRDLMRKVRTGLAADGPAFLNVISPCHRGWRFPPEESIDIVRHATEVCFWPLFEWRDGRYTINYKPKAKLSVESWLARQGRFAHLFEPNHRHIIPEIQAETDRRWEWLLRLEAESAETA